MDALSPSEWVAAGKVIDEFASELDKIFANGTYVDTTATGFLMHFTNAVVQALEEDRAWDEKARRDADEASEEAYDEYMNETQDGEYPQGWRDAHMI